MKDYNIILMEIRKSLRISQKQISLPLSIDRSTYSRKETGRRPFSSAELSKCITTFREHANYTAQTERKITKLHRSLFDGKTPIELELEELRAKVTALEERVRLLRCVNSI
jgi:hypothetical protein